MSGSRCRPAGTSWWHACATATHEGFDYERRAEVELAPRQNLAIDFRAETGGFIFR